MSALEIRWHVTTAPDVPYGTEELPLPPIGYRFASNEEACSKDNWRNAIEYRLHSSWPYQPRVWCRLSSHHKAKLYAIPL